MAGSLDEILSANEQYASSFGAKGELACRWRAASRSSPCMDARLDPAKYAGLSRGRCAADDVTRIRTHPLVLARIPIYGYLYDVTTGRLNEVAGATAAGRAA